MDDFTIGQEYAVGKECYVVPTSGNDSPSTWGWTSTSSGWVFVHRAGALGGTGSTIVDHQLHPAPQIGLLPMPTDDPDELRQAWLEGALPLRGATGRILAPLEGFVWRSVVGGPQRYPINLYGAGRSGKTSLARLAQDYFGGAEPLDFHNTTAVGRRRLLDVGKDMTILIDDVRTLHELDDDLVELVQQIVNRPGPPGQPRHRESRRHTICGSVVMISEAWPFPSHAAGSRCFALRTDPSLCSRPQPDECSSPASSAARSLLGASFLMWTASRYRQLISWAQPVTTDYATAWQRELESLDLGLRKHLAYAAAEQTIGFTYQLAFLLDAGALTVDEAEDRWRTAMAKIRQAAVAHPAGHPPNESDGIVSEPLFCALPTHVESPPLPVETW